MRRTGKTSPSWQFLRDVFLGHRKAKWATLAPFRGSGHGEIIVNKLRCWGITSMCVLFLGGCWGGELLVGFCGCSSLCLVNLLWEWLINEMFVAACLYCVASHRNKINRLSGWGFCTIALSDYAAFFAMTFTTFTSHLTHSFCATRQGVGSPLSTGPHPGSNFCLSKFYSTYHEARSTRDRHILQSAC